MSNEYMAIFNLTENESDIRSLTTNRPIASIPIGSRYRVIDFMLSNLVNCGITNVGIFTKSNSRSLTDHIGTGKPWDLNRKNDGIFIFNHVLGDLINNDSKLIKNNMEYIYRSRNENVILTSSYMVCNMDIADVIKKHEESDADLTIVYTKTNDADKNFQNCYTLNVDEKSGRVIGVGKNIGFLKSANICMEIFLMKKERFVKLIYKNAMSVHKPDFYNVLLNEMNDINVNGYYFEGFVSCINSIGSYYEANMSMLNPTVSNELFRNKQRPIYTKIKDEQPTFYAAGCNVQNSLIADGCIIKGRVKNSILGRYVDIEEDAEVVNSIILQNCRIKKGSKLTNVIIDKNATIEQGTELKGSDIFPLVIEKKNLQKEAF